MKKKKKYIIGSVLIIVIVLIIAFYVNKKSNKELDQTILQGTEYKEHVTIKTKTGITKEIPLTLSQWFAPYNARNKTNFSKITSEKFGVYFIREKQSKEVVYIGYSKNNLYKALYRHYQYYKDSGYQIRNNYERDETEVMIATTSKANAYRLERHFILEYNPRDTTHRYKDYQNEEKTQTIPDIETIDDWEESERDPMPKEIAEEDLPF